MGIIGQLKKLHKQTLLKFSDIKRAVIAKEAGVNSDEYLSRAKTLHDCTNPESSIQQENIQERQTNPTVTGNQGNTESVNIGETKPLTESIAEGQPAKNTTSSRSRAKANVKL